VKGTSWPWATGLILSATALLMFVFANSDRLPKPTLVFGCSVGGTFLLMGFAVVALPLSLRAMDRVFGVAVSPIAEQNWVQLNVRNRGKPDLFQVQVEEIESHTGATGLPYHAPWQENGGQSLRLTRGKTGTAIIAEVASVTEHERGRDMATLRFYSVESKPDGFFTWTTAVGEVSKCRINILRGRSGPSPGEYRLEVLADGVKFTGSR